VQVFYSDRYVIELPPGHTFPAGKYVHLHAILRQEGVLRAADVHEPEPAGRDDLLRVHTPDYHNRFVGGALSVREVRRLGRPTARVSASSTTSRSRSGSCRCASATSGCLRRQFSAPFRA